MIGHHYYMRLLPRIKVDSEVYVYPTWVTKALTVVNSSRFDMVEEKSAGQSVKYKIVFIADLLAYN